MSGKTLAVTVGPSGSDFGPETIIAFAGHVPCLEGGRLEFVGCCIGSACHDEFPFGCGSARCHPPIDRSNEGGCHVLHG
jgi:hypothetical protein